MRFVWLTPPQQKANKEPIYGSASENPEKEKLEKHQKDLADYLKGLADAKEVDKAKFLEQARAWESGNNLESFRVAGKTMEEDEKEPLLRHKLLSSAFLEEIKGRERLTFKVNFKGNTLAEYKIGAGDVFPPNVSVIAVNGRRAIRAINPETERIGYYDESELNNGKRYSYVPILTGDTVEILETRPADDSVVQRRKMQERVTIYQGRGMTAIDEAELTPEESRDAKKEQVKREFREQRGVGSAGVEPAKSGSSSSAPQVSTESAEVQSGRQRLVEAAKKYAGGRFFQENYFNQGETGKWTEGGRLGCALVVSYILKEAGLLNDLSEKAYPTGMVLGVALTENELRKRGWTQTKGPIEAGDVLVWAPANAPAGVQTRHGHIGIAVSSTEAVHNSNNYETDPKTGKQRFSFKGPIQEKIKRTPVAVWKPPGAITKKIPAATQSRIESPVEQPPRKTSATEKPKGTPPEKIKTQLNSKYGNEILKASKQYNVPVNLIMAVMWNESNGAALACSDKGAGGLMQLMPDTARGMGLKNIYPPLETGRSGFWGGKSHKIYKLDPRDDRANPEKNIMAGVKYLSSLIKRYNGDVEAAASAYNSGPGKVDPLVKKYGNLDQARAYLPAETRDYIVKIPDTYRKLNDSGKNA